MENTMLHNQIRKVFDTDAAFGLAIGWVPQKVNKLIYGKYTPKLVESVPIARALGVSLDEFSSFFTQ